MQCQTLFKFSPGRYSWIQIHNIMNLKIFNLSISFLKAQIYSNMLEETNCDTQ
jgi:hypothetical protein